jgi:hypothetical protein
MEMQSLAVAMQLLISPRCGPSQCDGTAVVNGRYNIVPGTATIVG